MRRFYTIILSISILAMACALPTSTPPAVTDAVFATVTSTVAIPPTVEIPPTQAVTSTPQPNAICNNLSFYLDPALASGTHCETLPEVNGPDYPAFGVTPQTTRITFDGYLLANRFHTPHIDIFPVQRFQEILPDAVNPRLTKLQGLIAGDAAGSEALPLLPVFNAAQLFRAQYAVASFQNGSGVRFIAQYAQAYYPINNHDMIYCYQGLTADGKYWVSLILPISHPGFAENGDMQPGPAMETLVANGQNYFSEKMTEMNAMAPDSFAPSILALDNLVQSISVQP